MNIQPIQNYNVSMQGKPNPNGGWKFLRKIEQKILNIFPEKTLKESEKSVENFKKYDTKISNPFENRLIMGATALLTQPAIDYYNHRVDDETRTVSRNRTIAKIIAGTAVGACVRKLCFNLIDNMTEIDGKGKNSKKLLPEKYAEEFAKDLKKLKNYKSALATIVALGAMCFTNIFLDAPLTLFLTNKFNLASNKNTKADKPSGLKEGIYA